jgi:hypothetical protein
MSEKLSKKQIEDEIKFLRGMRERVQEDSFWDLRIVEKIRQLEKQLEEMDED